jgi:hypothetical protein
MDLTGLQNLAAKQGPLFWGAAAAAALGASLLVAALALQTRRLRLRIRWRLPRWRLRRVPAPATLLARAVPGGYAPAGAAGYLATSAPVAGLAISTAKPDATPDYSLALMRLRRASEKLARLQPDSAESRLKATSGGVDLISRRGVG